MPRVDRVVLIVLENTSATDALGQPFLAELTREGAYVPDLKAVARPSQPNYIALTAGNTHGVDSNEDVTLNAKHLGNLVEEKGKSWKVYAESYPGGCFLGASAGPYARKHVPFLSFQDVQSDPTRCARVVPSDQLQKDIAKDAVPEFSLVIPNNSSNGHDTGVQYADGWLKQTLSPILKDSKFMERTLVIVTFDESNHDDDSNQVYTALIGANVQPGATAGGCYDHYSLLRTVEESLGLGTLGLYDEASQPIQGVWANS